MLNKHDIRVIELSWRNFTPYVEKQLADERQDVCSDAISNLYGPMSWISQIGGLVGLSAKIYGDFGTTKATRNLLNMYSKEAFRLQLKGPQVINKSNWEMDFGPYTPRLLP